MAPFTDCMNQKSWQGGLGIPYAYSFAQQQCSTSDLTPVKEKMGERKRKQRVGCTGVWRREVCSAEERTIRFLECSGLWTWKYKEWKKQLSWGMFHHDNLITGTRNSEHICREMGRIRVLKGHSPQPMPWGQKDSRKHHFSSKAVVLWGFWPIFVFSLSSLKLLNDHGQWGRFVLICKKQLSDFRAVAQVILASTPRSVPELGWPGLSRGSPHPPDAEGHSRESGFTFFLQVLAECCKWAYP